MELVDAGTSSPSAVESCDDGEPILLQSICANCSVQLSTKDFVADFTLPYDTGKRSVHEAVELIFKNNEVTDPKPNTLKFCSSCGIIFEQLLNSYIHFLHASFVGSYIHNLRYGVKVEAQDIDEEIYDNSILESLSITLHESPYGIQTPDPDENEDAAPVKPKRIGIRRRKGVAKGKAATGELASTRNILRRSSFRTRKATEHYKPVETKRRRIRKTQTCTSKDASAAVRSASKTEELVHDSVEIDYTSELSNSPVPSPPTSRRTSRFKVKVCSICKETPPPGMTMLEHKKMFHEFRYSCGQCDRKFRSSQSRGFHVRSIHSAEGKIKQGRICTICKVAIPPENTMVEHLKIVHPDLPHPFACSQCDRKFRSSQSRGFHMRSVHNIPRTCNRISSSAVNEETERAYPFQCSECEMRFRRKRGQLYHIRKAHRNPNGPHVPTRKKKSPPMETTPELKTLLHNTTYMCDSPDCLAIHVQFNSFKEWIQHQEAAHALETGYDLQETDTKELVPKFGLVRPCSQCGKKFKSVANMKTHLSAVHLKLRPYSCDMCPNTFSFKNALEYHKKSRHSAPGVLESQFLCTLCGSTFKTKGGLQAHEKTHFGDGDELKYVCKICQQRFRTSQRLKEHETKIHLNEQPFPCEHCQLTFKVKRDLDRHRVRQHFKKFIRDQICDVCGKGYAFKHHLKEHLLSFHKLTNEEALTLAKIKVRSVFRILPNGERVFPKQQVKPKTCDLCNRTYVRREQLFTHYMSVHGKTEEEAKEITGLESKRNLVPGRSEYGNKKKATSEAAEYFKL